MKELKELNERMNVLEGKIDEILSLLQEMKSRQWWQTISQGSVSITLTPYNNTSEEDKPRPKYIFPTKTDGSP